MKVAEASVTAMTPWLVDWGRPGAIRAPRRVTNLDHAVERLAPEPRLPCPSHRSRGGRKQAEAANHDAKRALVHRSLHHLCRNEAGRFQTDLGCTVGFGARREWEGRLPLPAWDVSVEQAVSVVEDFDGRALRTGPQEIDGETIGDLVVRDRDVEHGVSIRPSSRALSLGP